MTHSSFDKNGTSFRENPWALYDQMIAEIPEGIAVLDYCLGVHWSYVEADCGMGVAFTCSGGAKRTTTQDLRQLSLKELAALSKSWCFEEATLGVAALNAWFSQPAQLKRFDVFLDEAINLPDETVRKMDAFELYRPRTQGTKVAVVGHFPHVERIAEYALELTVLERNCRSELDTPDPACEYLLPSQDFVFLTGVTLINKTAPRLLELSRKATTVFVGPSVIPCAPLFECGVEMLAGSVVADPEKIKRAVKNGTGKMFGEALQMASVTLPKNN